MQRHAQTQGKVQSPKVFSQGYQLNHPPHQEPARIAQPTNEGFFLTEDPGAEEETHRDFAPVTQ